MSCLRYWIKSRRTKDNNSYPESFHTTYNRGTQKSSEQRRQVTRNCYVMNNKSYERFENDEITKVEVNFGSSFIKYKRKNQLRDSLYQNAPHMTLSNSYTVFLIVRWQSLQRKKDNGYLKKERWKHDYQTNNMILHKFTFIIDSRSFFIFLLIRALISLVSSHLISPYLRQSMANSSSIWRHSRNFHIIVSPY